MDNRTDKLVQIENLLKNGYECFEREIIRGGYKLTIIKDNDEKIITITEGERLYANNLFEQYNLIPIF